MFKQVLITSIVLHPRPLLSGRDFYYLCFSISFQWNNLSLMTILDLFRGGLACYPRQQLN